jgi:hypothetical protein
MAAKHGTRRCYNEGCRCDECKEAARAYWRDYQARKAAGEPTHSGIPADVWQFHHPKPAEPEPAVGRVEKGVIAELEGLAQADARPGLTQTVLALARLMDDPKAKNQQPAAAAKLAELLRELRKGMDARKSRLASVRAMTSAKSATG